MKISNETLWHMANEKEIKYQIKHRKWNWIGHTLRKDHTAIERRALDWNPQGSRKRGRLRNSWKRTVEEEARAMGKTWREIKALAGNKVCWRCFVEALCFYKE